MNKSNRQILSRVGFVGSAEGTVILSNLSAQLYKRWEVYLEGLFAEYNPSIFHPPIFIAKNVLKTSHYLEHFKQQIFISGGLNSSKKDKFITPAACLHIYPGLTKSNFKNLQSLYIVANCGRYEDGKYNFPFRFANFTMAEFVVVGNEQRVNSLLVDAQLKLSSAFKELRLNGLFKNATDAFFLDSNEGAKAMQKLKALKREYLVRVDGKEVALASINKHEDYFGKNFKLIKNNKNLHSFCIAFGLERLVAYSFLHWGLDPKKWPKGFNDA